MKNNVIILREGVVANVFVGNENGWTNDHMAQFPGCTFVFADHIPAIGSIYDQSTDSFNAPISVVVRAEDLIPVEDPASPEVLPE